MNNDNKEKLIEIVSKYECIYNPKCKEYKNVSYKRLLWEKIGATLQIEGSKAKDAWRSLRDGYIRHKKTIRGQTGSRKKYLHFTWSSQMSFLDSALKLRPTRTNITPPQPGSDALERQSSPALTQSSPALIHSPPSAQPGPSWLYPKPEIDDSSQSLEMLDLPAHSTSAQLQQLPTTSLQPSTSPATLKTKNKRVLDEVDYLFMSYAKSFKKISVRNQGKIKVGLAKLFADAELDDFENDSTNEGRNQTTRQQTSSLMYLSPDRSTETIFITEDNIQQTIQPVLKAEGTSHESDVLLSIDVTNHKSNESQ